MAPFLFRSTSSLPQEALDELRAILDNYYRLRQTNPPANAGDDAEMKKLSDKLDSDAGRTTVWWTDLLLAELCVVDLLPPEQLLARIPLWRRRYQEVLGNDTYTDYLKTAPDLSTASTPGSTGPTPAVLRADLYELIGDVYYYYAGYAVSARSRTEVSERLMTWAARVIAVEAAVLVLAFLIGVVLWHRAYPEGAAPVTISSPAPTSTPLAQPVAHAQPHQQRHSGDSAPATLSVPAPTPTQVASPAANAQTGRQQQTQPPTIPNWWLALLWLLATSSAAVVGCVVSVQRRLQDPTVKVDPFYRYIQTTADWFGIAVANPVFCAFFGMIMYGLLASQLLSTKLIAANSWTHGFPTDHPTQAAVLILGFLSGFAEQLIPDALTRLASSPFTGLAGAPSGNVAPQVSGKPSPSPNGQPAQVASPSAQTNGSTTAKPSDILNGTQTLSASPPLQPTSQAALLGHDPSLASVASAQDVDKGTN